MLIWLFAESLSTNGTPVKEASAKESFNPSG